jgi:hypothetical protein
MERLNNLTPKKIIKALKSFSNESVKPRAKKITVGTYLVYRLIFKSPQAYAVGETDPNLNTTLVSEHPRYKEVSQGNLETSEKDSDLLFVSNFSQEQPVHGNNLRELFYREQVDVEQQKEYDAKIVEATRKSTVDLSTLYTLRTNIIYRLKDNSRPLSFNDWVGFTSQLRFINESILEIETKNIVTSALIKDLYQHMALCYKWGRIPLPPKTPYPYSTVDQSMVPPTIIAGVDKSDIAKEKLDPRVTLPQVVDHQRIASVGFYEREGEVLKEKRGLMKFFKTEEKLSSPFFNTAPKGSIKVRTETIIVFGSADKNPTLESLTVVNADSDLLQDLFKKEKSPTKIVQGFKKVGRFFKSL